MFDYYLTAEDILASGMDNMSDEDIDRDLKLFKRVAQKLGVRSYNDLIVVPGEDDYNPDYYAQSLGISSTNLYKNNDSIKVWSVDGIDFVAEELNGTLYLYFKDETTASKYKDMVDKFNNDYAEGTNESLHEELDSDEWEEIASKQVQDFDGFWTDYTLYYNESEGRFVCIFGDKDLYDPTNADPDFECEEKWEAFEWFDDYDTGEMEGEDDTIYESMNESVNLNESLAQYYKIGDKGSELVYVVSAIRYSSETNSSDPYAAIYMTLVCGWDYCSDWSDKMGWVDPENWVEDVQTDYFIAYLSDESVAQAIEDNGYTPTEKPSPIYHYNEEKDKWEVLKESLSVDKYIKESLNELDHKSIDEDTKFYDLRSLYEAFSNKLTPEEKDSIQKLINSNADKEIIAAAISGISDKTKNEDLDVESNDLDFRVHDYFVKAFLVRKGPQNYSALYDDLWTNDLSEAEDFIWDSLQKGLYVEFNDFKTIKTKGYTTTRYFNPDNLDETTTDYRDLEESFSNDKLKSRVTKKFYDLDKAREFKKSLEDSQEPRIEISDTEDEDGNIKTWYEVGYWDLNESKRVVEALPTSKDKSRNSKPFIVYYSYDVGDAENGIIIRGGDDLIYAEDIDDAVDRWCEKFVDPDDSRFCGAWAEPADEEYIQEYFRKKESLNEDMNNVISDLESIEKFLSNENFHNYDVYNYESFPLDTSKIEFEVKGDWRHDHLLFKHLIEKWAEQNNRKIFKIDSREVGNSDSDYYTAIYSVYITKDDESFDILSKLRGNL